MQLGFHWMQMNIYLNVCPYGKTHWWYSLANCPRKSLQSQTVAWWGYVPRWEDSTTAQGVNDHRKKQQEILMNFGEFWTLWSPHDLCDLLWSLHDLARSIIIASSSRNYFCDDNRLHTPLLSLVQAFPPDWTRLHELCLWDGRLVVELRQCQW